MSFYHGKWLLKALVDEGLCPPKTRSAEMHVPVDGPVFIRLEALVDTVAVLKLMRAMTAIQTRDVKPLEPER